MPTISLQRKYHCFQLRDIHQATLPCWINRLLCQRRCPPNRTIDMPVRFRQSLLTRRSRISTATQIRMVAGFAEVIESEATLVAEGGFEPPTFGLRSNLPHKGMPAKARTLVVRDVDPPIHCACPCLPTLSSRTGARRSGEICLESWPIAEGGMALEIGVISVECSQFPRGYERVPGGGGRGDGHAG
jgi:hypothetical protein